jgi:hypothetical protein
LRDLILGFLPVVFFSNSGEKTGFETHWELEGNMLGTKEK